MTDGEREAYFGLADEYVCMGLPAHIGLPTMHDRLSESPVMLRLQHVYRLVS